MQKIIAPLIIAILLFVATGVFISDRDRAMWLLNSAVELANQRPVVSDISFGEQAWQKLDVYPAQSQQAAPVVMFIYGGSWKHGRKDQYFFAADALLRLGYTVVIPDYPKYPSEQALYPQFVVDAAAAVKWIKNNIQQHNGNPQQIFVAGHSAGAHTAIMLATDASFLAKQDLAPTDLKGVAGIAGPYSFVPNRVHTKAIFGPPPAYPMMDAVNFVNGDEPATLLLHSQGDEQVGLYNQQKLASKYQQLSSPIQTQLYGDISHIDIILKLHPWFAGEVNVGEDIDSFFRAQL